MERFKTASADAGLKLQTRETSKRGYPSRFFRSVKLPVQQRYTPDSSAAVTAHAHKMVAHSARPGNGIATPVLNTLRVTRSLLSSKAHSRANPQPRWELAHPLHLIFYPVLNLLDW